jgi:hypothetical protein
MDPAKVAFRIAEPPSPPTEITGCCARCSTSARLTPTREVVSRSFTGWDRWTGPAGGLCPACTWLYRTTELRTLPHLVTATPTFAAQTLTEVLTLLLTGALKQSAALSLPLRPGRRHLFADLTWGTIRTDHANLSWTASDAARLGAVHHLRQAGFTATDIPSPAPPFTSLRRLPSEQWAAIQHLWDSLAPWRTNPHWLAVALKVT